MKAIEIQNISKEIGGQVVLQNLDFYIKKGEIYGLLGENGAGKSTLMKMIFDIYKPSGGTIKILGKAVQHQERRVYKKISGIIEAPIFYQNLSVLQNLEIHCDYVDARYKADIDEMLQQVGLATTMKSKKTKTLSMGMKQRLALARALLCRPEVLVLDEPINGLDPKGVLEIRELLLHLKAQGLTILISSHIIAELEKIVDRIGIIHQGSMVSEYDMSDMKARQLDLETIFMDILSTKKEV